MIIDENNSINCGYYPLQSLRNDKKVPLKKGCCEKCQLDTMNDEVYTNCELYCYSRTKAIPDYFISKITTDKL